MKKKILFFIPSLAGGGAEKVLVNMVNNLDENKFDITVKTLFDYGVNRQFLSEKVKYEFVFKKVFRGNTKIFKLFSPEFLYKKMIKKHYDLIVSYFQSPTTRIIAGCPDESTKIIQWIHNEFHEKEKIAVCYRSIEECIRLQKRYDATVYVSETVKDIYLNTFPEIKKNDKVLYNVVESDVISKKSNERIENKDLYTHKFTLISVGRMVPQKSFDRLINVVKRLDIEGIDVGLLLLGTGELEGKLKNQVKELGLEKNIKFLGYQENPYKYVKNADLFVCSSLHEGFSTAMTEALIIGTPVITTMCSGMIELLGKNEYGVIVENDETALYNGIKNILENPSILREMKVNAFKRGKKFDVIETTYEIEAFLDSVLEVEK